MSNQVQDTGRQECSSTCTIGHPYLEYFDFISVKLQHFYCSFLLLLVVTIWRCDDSFVIERNMTCLNS